METLVLRSFKLPLSLDESLAAHAVDRGVTKSDLVRELLRRGLEAEQSTGDMTRVMARLEKLDTIEEKLGVLEGLKEKLGLLERVERKLGNVATAVTSLTELIRPAGRASGQSRFFKVG